jgi:hypothetical protein
MRTLQMMRYHAVAATYVGMIFSVRVPTAWAW